MNIYHTITTIYINFSCLYATTPLSFPLVSFPYFSYRLSRRLNSSSLLSSQARQLLEFAFIIPILVSPNLLIFWPPSLNTAEAMTSKFERLELSLFFSSVVNIVPQSRFMCSKSKGTAYIHISSHFCSIPFTCDKSSACFLISNYSGFIFFCLSFFIF